VADASGIMVDQKIMILRIKDISIMFLNRVKSVAAQPL